MNGQLCEVGGFADTAVPQPTNHNTTDLQAVMGLKGMGRKEQQAALAAAGLEMASAAGGDEGGMASAGGGGGLGKVRVMRALDLN